MLPNHDAHCKRPIAILTLILVLFMLCVFPMLSGMYTYNRTHVEVVKEDIQYASVKNTPVTQQIYCQGAISNLGISFYAPSGQLYGDAAVSITVEQNGRSVTERVPAAKLRTLSAYEKNQETQREEDSIYEMCYILRTSLRKFTQGPATITVISDNLPEGTDLFCLVSSTMVSGLPSAMAGENILGAPMVLEYDVFFFNSHFWYETVLCIILLLLFVFVSWVLVYRRCWLDRGELLYWSTFLIIVVVVSIRNPYASFWGEPRSEATYEFWYKAENLGFFGSLMSLMSGEALAWWERILMWVANVISPRKYVFVTAQLMELAWIAMVTAMPCLRSFRRFFPDEARLAVSLLFGTALLFDSAYYFWSCSYWALFFFLLFPLLDLDQLHPVAFWSGIALTVVLCVSRIYHILLVPVAVAAFLVMGKQRGTRFRVYCGMVAAASLFEVIYSFSASANLAAESSMLRDILDIGLWRMIENTLYYQIQVINSFFTGAVHWQGSGTNVLGFLILFGILAYFILLLAKKEWAKACWLGGLGVISLGSIAINVFTCGSHAAVSFPLNYASNVNWGQNIYQEADLHFSYSYICLSFILLTLVYWAQKPLKKSIQTYANPAQATALCQKSTAVICAVVSIACCIVASCNVKKRLTYDRITVEWKSSYQVTENPDYFLAVNTFYRAAPISLEQGTDEMIFGVDSTGTLYEWLPWLPAYEQYLPYHRADIGAVSQAEQQPVLSVTARRALTNFQVSYVAVLRDRNGTELARAVQAQTDNRLWLDFLFNEPVTGVYTVSFELLDGSAAYIQDGLQIGFVKDLTE